ncbi:Mpv17-like protein [Drosera capensis]
MSRLWRWYQNCLATHPVKTQMISSGLIWGFGDIAAQSITHLTLKGHRQFAGLRGRSCCRFLWRGKVGSSRKPFSFLLRRAHSGSYMHLDDRKELRINWKRVAATSLFGFGFVGPVGHFWYEGLDRFIRHRLKFQPNSTRFVGTKVALDGIIFGPLDLLVFFSYMGFANGKMAPQIKEDVKRDFLPALVLEGGIWPIVQVANFRYVPVRNQLLYVNFFCLLDSCFLSWLEQQEDAPWKQWITSQFGAKEKTS